MPSDEPLHPNLARIAAAYDTIVEQFEAGRISARDARSRIAQLEARDDAGVRWSLDPDTGSFVRKTAFGELAFDTPPSFGLPTPDAHSYTGLSGTGSPASRVRYFEASPQQPGLTGATYRLPALDQATEPSPRRTRHTRTLWAAAAAAALAAAFVAGWLLFTGGHDTPSPAGHSSSHAGR